MAYGVVRQCGGHIFVDSKLGRGTRFDIYLPQIQAAVDANKTPFGLEDGVDRAQCILLVEDEPDVCDLIRMLLEQGGYHVLVASNGAEALLVARLFQGPIHLLLTDVVMPEKNGPELAQELLKERPDTKVLFMSGYTEHAVSQRNLLAPGTPLIQKPFGPGVLIPRVREVLEKEDSEVAAIGAAADRSYSERSP